MTRREEIAAVIDSKLRVRIILGCNETTLNSLEVADAILALPDRPAEAGVAVWDPGPGWLTQEQVDAELRARKP